LSFDEENISDILDKIVYGILVLTYIAVNMVVTIVIWIAVGAVTFWPARIGLYLIGGITIKVDYKLQVGEKNQR
jgi:hypothetical protein